MVAVIRHRIDKGIQQSFRLFLFPVRNERQRRQGVVVTEGCVLDVQVVRVVACVGLVGFDEARGVLQHRNRPFKADLVQVEGRFAVAAVHAAQHEAETAADVGEVDSAQVDAVRLPFICESGKAQSDLGAAVGIRHFFRVGLTVITQPGRKELHHLAALGALGPKGQRRRAAQVEARVRHIAEIQLRFRAAFRQVAVQEQPASPGCSHGLGAHFNGAVAHKRIFLPVFIHVVDIIRIAVVDLGLLREIVQRR